MLMEWILSASVLTAAVLVLRLVFRRRISQKLQYWLWLPVLLRLLIPVPLFHARYSVSAAAEHMAPAVFAAPAPASTARPVATAPAVTAAPAPVSPRPAETAPAAPSAPAPAVTAAPTPAMTAAPAPAVTAAPTPTQPKELGTAQILARLWLAGSLAAALWLLGVNLRFAQRLRGSRRELRRGKLPVYVTPAAASPCLFGILQPAVYLTEVCAEAPEAQQRQVLLHEETHYRQLDHIWGCLRCLCLAVWWWNPLVWLAAVCSRRDGELSCDETVMKRLGEEARMDYGRTLLALLPGKTPRPLLSTATLSGGARAMKERLNRIVKRPKAWALAAAAVLLLALAAAGCAFAGRPAETLPPTATPSGEALQVMELLGMEPGDIQDMTFAFFPLGESVLLRGEEGFEEVLALLSSLRCGPETAEEAEPLGAETYTLRKLYLNGGGRTLWLQRRGERIYVSTSRDDFAQRRLLLGEGRPDEELEALFARYVPAQAASYAPKDYGVYTEEGFLALRMTESVYGPDALAEGEIVLRLENRGETAALCLDPGLQVLRGENWYNLPRRSGSVSFGATLLEAGGTLEKALSPAAYESPLAPGYYRLWLSYSVGGDPQAPFDWTVYTEFEIAESEVQPGPGGEAEKLLGAADPEKVKSIEYRLNVYDHYFLDRGDMGFDTALDMLFSLRGEPCEKPEGLLVSRSFTLDGVPDISLAFDGERVFARMFSDRWYLLDARGRPDQNLTDIFLYWGREEETPEQKTHPAAYGSRIEDGSLTVETLSPVFDLAVMRASLEQLRILYRDRGEEPQELVQDLMVTVRVTNHTGEAISVPYDMGLEALRDGEWQFIPWREGLMSALMGYDLGPGEEISGLGIPMLNYYEEALTPGRYRVCLPYRLSLDKGGSEHVAYAEFEIVDGPQPDKTYIPICQDYPATEARGAYHLSFRVPAGWSSVDLSPEEAAQQGLLYLYNGTEDRHYLRDESGNIIGAFGCAAYEAAEELPEAIYAALSRGNGWRFDVAGSYTPVAEREFGENARTKAYYAEAFLRPFAEQPGEKRNEGFLSYDRALHAYAAVELEPGVLTEEEMDTLARSLYLEHEEPEPEQLPEPEPIARFAPEPEVFGSYEEARAITEATAFQWVDKPGTYQMSVRTSDPIVFDLERAYPGFGALLCGRLPDTSPHGDPTYLYFLSEEGTRYRLPTPCTLTSDLPLDDGGAARAEEGEAFRLEFPSEDKVRWWTFAATPVNIFGNLYDPDRMTEPEDPLFRGGTLVWELDIPTMEVFIRFQPQE